MKDGYYIIIFIILWTGFWTGILELDNYQMKIQDTARIHYIIDNLKY